MKREIDCLSCASTWERIAKDPEVIAAGETIVITRGSAKQPFKCDGCGRVIEPLTACAAITVLMAGQSAEPEWEREYISRAS